MFQHGVFVIGYRKFFKKLQQNCFTCRRIRKQQMSSIMGPSWQLQGMRKCPPFSVCYADPVGYFKLLKDNGKVGKIWFLTVSCLFTRYTLYLPLETMTSDSILRALRIAGWSTGNAQIKIVHCDRGANLLPFLKFGDEN